MEVGRETRTLSNVSYYWLYNILKSSFTYSSSVQPAYMRFVNANRTSTLYRWWLYVYSRRGWSDYSRREIWA